LRIFFGLAKLFKCSKSENKVETTDVVAQLPVEATPVSSPTEEPQPIIQEQPQQPDDLPLSGKENRMLMFACEMIGKSLCGEIHRSRTGRYKLNISSNCFIVLNSKDYYDSSDDHYYLQVFVIIDGETIEVSNLRGPWFPLIRKSIDELYQKANQIQEEKRRDNELKIQKEKIAEEQKEEKLRSSFAKLIQKQEAAQKPKRPKPKAKVVKSSPRKKS
jgi:hypothetical protein